MGLKIFSSFISVFIIFLISFLTFFSGAEGKLDYYSKFKTPQNGLFSIFKDKNSEFVEVTETKDSQILLERFDFIDKIFFNTKGSYIKTQSRNNTALKVGRGKFFLSFSFPKKYEVSGSGFRLSFVGPIKLYLNTEDTNKVDIFSLDNMAELSLIGLEDGKLKTKVYAYPHMLLSFNLKLNKILKNTDLFRISQLNDITYVNQNLYTTDYKLEEFKNLDNSFFKTVTEYFSNEYSKTKTDNSFLEENFNNMTYDYIKKYFYIFVNDNKKVAYYKDLIYMNLLKIYMYPDNPNSIFSETEEYYKNLKILSEKDYVEMLKVLVYFKSKFLLDNKLGIIETELKYDQILSSVFSFQKMQSNYMLYYIFNLYDLGNKENFFDGLISFSDNYFKDNGLKIQEDKLIGYDDSKTIKLGYYISFLESIIKSHLIEETDMEDIKGIFNLFNKYSLLSVSIYSGGSSDKKKTTIVMHLNLLKELSEYIRNNFFETELDKGIMLVKKKGINLDSDVVSLFENSYNKLFDFFTYNNKVFDENLEKDFLYLKEYEFISFNFIEYINALKNYDKYKLEKSDLYSIQTIGGDNVKKIIYNIDDIKNYLLAFNGVNKDSIKVKTDETGNIFNASLNIGGKIFSFDLAPYNNYTIKNIYIDGIKKNLTYSLSLIKEKMDQRYESSSNPEDRNMNDFNNFFINTFLKTKTYSPTNEDNDEDLPKENIEILVFKRDKLLGPKGEFVNIKDFTDIVSENIIVTIDNGKIGIKLENIKTTFTYNEGRENITYGAYLDSDYYIGNNEHYFSNIKLRLFKSVRNGNKNVDVFGLGNGKNISVVGNLGIITYKDYMSNIISNYNNIVFVNDELVKKVGQTEVSVNSSKIVKFTFIYNGHKYEMSLLDSNIVNLRKDGAKVLQTTFNYTDLPNRINLLIK